MQEQHHCDPVAQRKQKGKKASLRAACRLLFQLSCLDVPPWGLFHQQTFWSGYFRVGWGSSTWMGEGQRVRYGLRNLGKPNFKLWDIPGVPEKFQNKQKVWQLCSILVPSLCGPKSFPHNFPPGIARQMEEKLHWRASDMLLYCRQEQEILLTFKGCLEGGLTWRPKSLRDNKVCVQFWAPYLTAVGQGSRKAFGQRSMPGMTGGPGYRTMETNGGSSVSDSYLLCAPCVPLFIRWPILWGSTWTSSWQ